ncbi:uncharacterized protein LOC128984559 [Macrosteles quadrilineatus]|uniref:uncharacterized protein LOC128984559 n=1 Tax=Macrosteles quadrilineatus TaxID=74068 RepID=UPI0023E21923|nr:uncharacterized protein LOC128984559 [Macrosteles quadrilineatus]
MSLIVSKMNTLKMIRERTPEDLIKNITCENEYLKEKCLEKKCMECKGNKVAFLDYNEEDSVTLYQWVDKKVEVQMKGRKKICKKTTKEEITCSKKKLKILFQSMFDKFVQHVNNIIHQHHAVRQIKKTLKENEAFLHIDFSENYNCKFGQEIQSFHFGGSRDQVSMHTSVLYYHGINGTVSQTLCTLSENRRHDSVAICGHLVPIFTEIKKYVPNLEKVHFLSDGPTNQYRNRKMFVLAAKFIARELNVETLHWHFSEANHGKGAPDGVGGVLKRTADCVVARGKDIPSIDALIRVLEQNCKGVHLFKVDTEDILKLDTEFHGLELPKFKGILKVHEIAWSRKMKDEISARRLSCLLCEANQECDHYEIGKIMIQTPKCDKNHDGEGGDDNVCTNLPAKSKKQKTFRKKKPIYSAIYSDSDSDPDNPPELNVKTNDFVVVKVFGKKTLNFYADTLDPEKVHYNLILKKTTTPAKTNNLKRKAKEIRAHLSYFEVKMGLEKVQKFTRGEIEVEDQSLFQVWNSITNELTTLKSEISASEKENETPFDPSTTSTPDPKRPSALTPAEEEIVDDVLAFPIDFNEDGSDQAGIVEGRIIADGNSSVDEQGLQNIIVSLGFTNADQGISIEVSVTDILESMPESNVPEQPDPELIRELPSENNQPSCSQTETTSSAAVITGESYRQYMEAREAKKREKEEEKERRRMIRQVKNTIKQEGSNNKRPTTAPDDSDSDSQDEEIPIVTPKDLENLMANSWVVVPYDVEGKQQYFPGQIKINYK